MLPDQRGSETGVAEEGNHSDHQGPHGEQPIGGGIEHPCQYDAPRQSDQLPGDFAADEAQRTLEGSPLDVPGTHSGPPGGSVKRIRLQARRVV